MGIDFARRQHMATVLNAQGQTVRQAFVVDNNREGIDQLLRVLAGLGETVETALEATGHYWLALFDQLTQAGYRVQVFNPLQVYAYRRSGIRKTDAIDAFWIADYLRMGGSDSSAQGLDARLQLISSASEPS